MIFKIVDGRECFYQWDTNRQIAVGDPTITEVHFCNRVDNCSLVVEVVDGVANVPNLILQYGFKLKVFGYDGEATMHEQEFEVKARTKPSDYVYTETEIKRFDDLNKRIDVIEAEGISQEAIDTAVGKYLEENPIQDITKVSQLENDADYATGGYVDAKVAGIVMPDLEPYAKKTDIPNTAGLASKSFVVSYVGEVVKDVEVDLTDYAKKSDIPRDYLTEIPAQYVTESELQAKGYSTFSGRYADLTGKPEIPSTDGLASVTYVDNRFNEINLEPYATKAHVAMTYAKKSDIPTDYLKEVPAEYVTDNELAAKNYANKTYVDDVVKNAVDTVVDGLATEDFVNESIAETKGNYLEVSRTTSEVAATAQQIAFIEAVLADPTKPAYLEYLGDITPAIVNSLGGNIWEILPVQNAEYMTQNRGNYNSFKVIFSKASGSWTFRMTTSNVILATQAYVNEKIAAIPGGGGSGEGVDLSNYYTKAEVDSKIPDTSNFVTMAQVEAKGYIKSVPSEYVTETELNGKGYLTQHQSLAGYATESYVGTAIQNALNAIGVAEGGAY